MHPIDVTRTKGLDVARRPILTLPKRHVRDDEVTTHIYGLQMLHQSVGTRPKMRKKIYVVELDYPLGYQVWTLLSIGLNFAELINDDMPTDKD